MIRVINEDSYKWLLSIKDIKINYIRKYIESYIEEIFNIKIDITENNTEFNLESSTLFGSVRKILDRKDKYKVSKIVSDEEIYFDKEYSSIDCKYNHLISLIGDMEEFEYLLIISINDSLYNSLSDQELINLYNEDDEILLSLISDQKQIRR